MEDRFTRKIEAYIGRVRFRLLVKYMIPPVLGGLFLLGMYLLAESVIDDQGWSVPLGVPLNTLLFWVMAALLVYVWFSREAFSKGRVCRTIDQEMQASMPIQGTSFEEYHEIEHAPYTRRKDIVRELYYGLFQKDSQKIRRGYEPHKIIPLWQNPFWRILPYALLFILLCWLLSMVSCSSRFGTRAARQDKEKPTQLEQKARKAENQF